MSGEPERRGRHVRVTVGGAAELVVQLPIGPPEAAHPRQAHLLRLRPADAGTDRLRAEVVVDGWRFEVAAEDARLAALRERAARAAAAHQGTTAVTMRAQIPGRVTRVWVSEGEQVEQGQRLLAVEAMKMENEIRAPRAGTVARLAVGEGARIELNAELLTLA